MGLNCELSSVLILYCVAGFAMSRLKHLLQAKRRCLRQRCRRGIDPDVRKCARICVWWAKSRLRRLILFQYLLKSSRRRHIHGRVRPPPRRWLVRPLMRERRRLGAWYSLVPIMRAMDPDKFLEFFRMTPVIFDELVASCRPALQRRAIDDGISPAERVAITLRYLASGDAMASISFLFLVGRSTVSEIIRETTGVIWEVLVGVVFTPLTPEGWVDVANEFERPWHFPNCVGAIDGRHCIVQNFPRGGSEWFNYKKTFSMVLLAAVDAKYRFLAVDIGGRGCRSDGGLFTRWGLGQRLRTGHLGLPAPRTPPGFWKPTPFVFVADAAFGLAPNLLTPYPGENLSDDKNVFNYRLSRARRCVENAFGIMTARWRVLRRTLLASRETAQTIIQAVVCLHNLLVLNEENSVRYIPPGYHIGADRRQRRGQGEDADIPEVLPIQGLPGDRAEAVRVRTDLTNYFISSSGRVPWQWRHLRRY